MIESKPAWDDVKLPRYATLNEDIQCDVLVIGGGITGLTAAYLLSREGQSVCLLERDSLGHGDTGCTTAHLTYVTDQRLSELVKHFGKAQAALVWQGGAAAINLIEQIAREEQIACDLRRVPGYLHASLEKSEDESAALEADCKLARELGFEASIVQQAPVVNRPAVRFANVGLFHPLKYLAGLAEAATAAGCQIFEESEAEEFLQDPLRVKVNGRQVQYNYVVIATHVPLMGKTGFVNATLFQSKLAPYSSYVVGAAIPGGQHSQASFWDTSDPYYYLRIDRVNGEDYAVFGGQDHKTGQVDDMDERYAKLERMLKGLIPSAELKHRWSGQVVETHDGLPYIGETADKQFVATGFAGNGMTFGTLAGLMARDAALARENPWQELFQVDRKPIRGGTLDYLTENMDYPYYMVRDWLAGSEAKTTRDVKRGEGKILMVDGKRVACSRDDAGKLSAVSAVCTHMGCLVHWNSTETTWDCPCHGSRFSRSGEVIAGPAEAPLDKVKLPPQGKWAKRSAAEKAKS
jgi:glycine/D-amino acid oxidase-like deaminating enzyme/nitrite reductase/ring-hydroxylating ferredoxin subunit